MNSAAGLLAIFFTTASLSSVAWSQQSAPATRSANASATAPATASPTASTTLKRDTERCRVHAAVDACYNAIRWSPGDPVLLVALGDALMHAGRPADALRNYRRAATLAPNTHGLGTKIGAAEARMVMHAPRHAKPQRAVSLHAEAEKHYSNAAPEAQSH